MKITWYGTASISIETKENKVLFDPFLMLEGSENHVDKEAFIGFNKIFLTHGHIDHLVNVPDIVSENQAIIYTTNTPRQTLMDKGVESDRIHRILPGDILENGDMNIQVYQGRHIKFDKRLVFNTFVSTRMIKYRKNFPYIWKENKICKENGEIVAYLIEAENKRVMVLGSLGLDADTDYPTDMDVLILPYQGRSKLNPIALEIVGKLRPKRIILDHFDDAFPPISNHISTDSFITEMKNIYPDIEVAKLKAGCYYSI